MPLNETTVPLQPRNASGCLDVAVKFYGRHLIPILDVVMAVALPAAVLTYLLTWRLDQDFRLTIVVLYLATWLVGVLTVAGAARAMFGQPFFPREVRANRRSLFGMSLIAMDAACGLLILVVLLDIVADLLGSDFLSGQLQMVWYVLLLAFLSFRLAMILGRLAVVTPGFAKALALSGVRRFVVALGPLLVLFPYGTPLVLLGIGLSVLSIILMIRFGFQPESNMLASIDTELHGRGIKELLKKEGGELFIRGGLIAGFGVIISLVIFFTADQAFQILLSYPIFIGRLESVLGDDSGWETYVIVMRFLFSDPRCLTVLTGSVLLVYPIVRLAWFFCYIDLRVRRDCWDIELSFQQEVRRLEGMA